MFPLESLESKLGRLSSDQRREIEDFVDFLLSRSAVIPVALPGTQPAPPVMSSAPPVFTAQELSPVRVMEESPVPVETNNPLLIQEITAGGDDWVTRDYMDYGKFEEQSSPATEAVKKVKQIIIKKEGQEKPRHILEWID